MKIRSLLLGSVAAAGLSTGAAYAADLGVLTSLDVCDSLGLSGLTISSDTNCLQITGEVKYKFTWGDYSRDASAEIETPAGTVTWIEDDGGNDWESRFDAWIKFVATASSDFGPAKAVLKLKEIDDKTVKGVSYSNPSQSGYASSYSYFSLSNTGIVTLVSNNGVAMVSGSVYTASSTVTASNATSANSYSGINYSTSVATSDTNGVVLDEAYVSIGDSTVISAGKKSSILNKGDDAPLNWLGLFNSSKVDSDPGVHWTDGLIKDGGHVIQVETDLGNGLFVKGGLENLNGSDALYAGTAVGVLSYAGDGLSAHVSFAANGILAGEIQDWGVHAGFAGTFDNFKVVMAGAFDSTDYWNVLASASATFDMFTIAASVEAAETDKGGYNPSYDDYYGAGASITAAVTEGVTLNVGGRWAHLYDGDETYEVAASVAASVTENVTVTGTVGYVSDDWQDLFYGTAKLDWNPGGSTFTSSVKGTVTSVGGYKLETEFKKTFE